MYGAGVVNTHKKPEFITGRLALSVTVVGKQQKNLCVAQH